jgi:hypothetical protein
MLRLLAAGFSVAAAIPGAALADNPAATVQVDANSNRHPVSPLIYGANWADQATLSDLNLPINRRGGNATTTYNWQINATNRAGDWYFESLSEGEGAVPSGSADFFINATKAAGAESMITIPMVDWVAKLGPNREGLTPYSVAKYGAQTASDPWWPDAGNGVRASDGVNITWNDPNDAYVPNSPAFQQQWVQYLVNTFGTSSSGGVKYYLTDNEHGVWPWNHRPIMPVGQTMDQIRDRIIAYAGMVKGVDPAAQIVGPEEWGWTNYFNSPFDTAGGNGADRAAHGGMDYMPWLLQQLKANNDATGQRLLDVFSLHYYPQYSEFGQGDSSTAAQLKRNECTRDLWDPNYVSTSWIWNSVKLIPRMKEWVNAYYPGTKIGITEYSWGAENHISGAIAQADVLGIFGREGVDLATFWGSLDSGLQIRNAFKMYRNYDGLKSTFGDTSVAASVANPDNVSAFAAQRSSDNALTVMVICKHLSANTPVTVNLGNFTAGNAAQVWQLTGAGTINRLTDAAVSNGSIAFSAPPQSITLFVVPGSTTPPVELLAHWKFNETSGTVAMDSSGNGLNAAVAGGGSWIAGVQSNAVKLNGTDGYVGLPQGLVSGLNDFTVSTFVKVDANATWARLFDFGSGTGTYMYLSPASGGNTVRYAITTSSNGGEQQLNSPTPLTTGVWHHVAVTLSGNRGVLYIDGAPVATNPDMTLKPSSLGSTTQNYIGKSQWWDPTLNGSVDDFRIYGRALSGSEVATLAAAKLPSPWATQDIGATGVAGTADYVNGTFTIQGAGANIGGAADAFRYVHQPSSGDCSSTVRVTSVPNTGANAKAGVMIRESSAAGAMEAGVWVTPSSGIVFTSRNGTGGSTSVATASGLTAPYWVRITRSGNKFSAYRSSNGTSWTRLGTAKTINMSGSAQVGMGVCSGASGVLNTATMDNATTNP